MSIQKPRGTQDILPDVIYKWNYLEKKIKEITKLYGFQEIRTPMFEDTNLFLRGIGDTTDIVQKEMYTFPTGDSKKNTYTLRPENTAAAIRAYLENKIYGFEDVTKWFYIGSMFRHDKPQSGRYREFHQFGVESIGSDSPIADAEVISLALQFFESLGLKELNVELNSVGCPNCRPKYKEKLIAFFEPKFDLLCPDCQSRLYKNPLRILDCKVESCRDLAANAPQIHKNLCHDCNQHFSLLQVLLKQNQINFHLNPKLVRGLDYYTKTAFEVQYTPLGSQSAIAGGGRYDGLVEELDGNHTPAVGFAAGLERVLLALESQGVISLHEDNIKTLIIPLDKENSIYSFSIATLLRNNGISCDIALKEKTLKTQLKNADKQHYDYVIIIGDEEAASNTLSIKNMNTGCKEIISRDLILSYLK